MPAWPARCGGTAWWPVPASGPYTLALSGGSAAAAPVRQSPANIRVHVRCIYTPIALKQSELLSLMATAIKSEYFSYLIQENPRKRRTVSGPDKANHISNAPLQGAGIQTQFLRRLSFWRLQTHRQCESGRLRFPCQRRKARSSF